MWGLRRLERVEIDLQKEWGFESGGFLGFMGYRWIWVRAGAMQGFGGTLVLLLNKEIEPRLSLLSRRSTEFHAPWDNHDDFDLALIGYAQARLKCLKGGGNTKQSSLR